MKETRDANIRPFVLPPGRLILRIRTLAARSDTIRWSHHARQRMAERDISIRVATSVLQLGEIIGMPEAGTSDGEWKAKVARRTKGMRSIGVVVIAVREDHLLVKTVEWEDTR